MCHPYLPTECGIAETYGKHTVTLNEEDVGGDFTMRKVEIKAGEGQARMSAGKTGFTVTQFHYTEWPEDGVPQSTTAVLEVANLIQKVQMSTGNKAIVVMCK